MIQRKVARDYKQLSQISVAVYAIIYLFIFSTLYYTIYFINSVFSFAPFLVKMNTSNKTRPLSFISIFAITS